MDYTDDQYNVMEKLSGGIIFYDQPEPDQEIIHYLDEKKLVQPRAYIADGYMELSQEGKRILNIHREQVKAKRLIEIQNEQERRNAEQLREQEQKETQALREQAQLKELQRREEQAQNEAKQEADKKASVKSDHRFQLLNTFLGALLGYLFGRLSTDPQIISRTFDSARRFITSLLK